jgi:replicative DNA helicase
MDYGNGLISTVLSTASLGEAIEAGVKTNFFTEPRDQQIWSFMTGHFQRYGVAPSTEVLGQSYPSYDIGEYAQPLQFFIDGLAERRREALAINFVQSAVERLNEEGPDRGGDVFTQMKKVVLQADIETQPTQRVSFVDKIRRSFPEWMNGSSKPTIPFGIPSLDDLTGGMRQEQFVILSGLAKSRKTWTMLHIASNVHAYGYPVVFLTFEMSNDELSERLATLWGHIPFQMVRDKMGLTADHQRQMMKALDRREVLMPNFLGVEDTAGHSSPSTIQALMQEVKPAVVFVDGVYLMTDDVTQQMGGSDPKPLTNISRALKRLAKNQKIVVVGSTQQLFSKTTKGRTSLSGIGYTNAFSQDADVLIGVEATEDLRDIATMRVHGNRSGPQGGEFNITWNLETGLVEEVGVVDTMETADYDDIDPY